MKSIRILKQIVAYAVARKKYWLVPFAVLLVVLAIVIFTAQGSVVAPFIYTLF